MNHQPTHLRMIFALLKPVDWVIDCLNLFRHGFTYRGGKWIKPIRLADGTNGELEFLSRDRAIDHLRDMIASHAVKEAIKNLGTNFSGKSRNAQCPCGSGKKFKACCMTNNRHEIKTPQIVDSCE